MMGFGLLYQWLSLINQRYGQIDISQQETLPSCRGWLLTHESCRNGGEEELLAPDRDSVLGVLHLPDQVLQLTEEDYIRQCGRKQFLSKHDYTLPEQRRY